MKKYKKICLLLAYWDFFKIYKLEKNQGAILETKENNCNNLK